jgi:hypothetical protein
LPGQDFGYYYQRVRTGYNGGNWLGLSPAGSIFSTAAANDPSLATSLNIVDNSLLGLTTFGNWSVDASNILIKYSYYGDVDLNGQVNADDLTVFGNNFGRLTGATQIDGDVDFDNDVDADDLTVFANSFGKGVNAPLASGAVEAVPEPSTILLAGLASAGFAAAGMIRRRRVKSPCGIAEPVGNLRG